MSKAYRMSIGIIEETCPVIDDIAAASIVKITELFSESSEIESKIIDIFNEMVSDFKANGTVKMREAITSLCADYIQLESKKNCAESKLSEVQSSADYWENQAADLQIKIDEMYNGY